MSSWSVLNSIKNSNNSNQQASQEQSPSSSQQQQQSQNSNQEPQVVTPTNQDSPKNADGSSVKESMWRRAQILKQQHTLKDVLQKPWRFRTKDEEKKVVDELKQFSFFSQLPPHTFQCVAKKATMVKFAKDHMIHLQSQYIRSIFFVLEGEIYMLNKMKQPDVRRAARTTIHPDIEKYGLPEFTLRPGDVLGEELITNQPVDSNGIPLADVIKPPQLAKYTAKTKTEVILIDVVDWDHPNQSYPMETNFVPSLLDEFFSLPPIRRSPEMVGLIASQVRRQFHKGVTALDEQALDGIVRVAALKKIKQGEVLFEQGDPGGQWYLIKDGLADVLRHDDASKVRGEDFRCGMIDLQTAYGPSVAVMKKGEVFGELAMHKGSCRQATIVGKNNLSLLTVKTDVFDRVIASQNGAVFVGMEWEALISKAAVGKADMDDEYILLSMMKTIRFFQQLPDDMLKKLATSLSFESYQANEIIVKQGDSNVDTFCLYVILSGSVGVHVMGQNLPIRFEAWRVGCQTTDRDAASHGKLRELCLGKDVFTMHMGDSFGERAILSGEMRTSTCVALSKVDLAVLSRKRYLQVIESMPQLSHSPDKIAALLEVAPWDRTADELTKLSSLVKSIPTFQKVPAPVVHALCRQMTMSCYNPNDVIFHQGEMGTYVCVILSGRASVHVKDDSHVHSAEVAKATTDSAAHKNVRMYGHVVAQLSGGNVIGESVMYMDNPIRMSSVISAADTRLMIMDVKHLRPYIPILSRNYFFENKFLIAALRKDPKNRSSPDKDAIVRALQGMPAAKNLPVAAMRAMASLVKFDEKEKGETIIGKGDPSNKYMIILSGTVAVFGKRDTIAEELSALENEKPEGEGGEGGDTTNATSDVGTSQGPSKALWDLLSGGLYAEEEEEEEEAKIEEYGTPDEKLHDGRGIGDIEIVTRQPFSRTFVTWEPTRLIVMDRISYEQHLLRFQPSEVYRTATFLRDEVDALRGSDISKLLSLSRLLVPHQFQRGHPITKRGEAVDCMMIVREGFATVLMKAPGQTNKMKSEQWLRSGIQKIVGEDSIATNNTEESHEQLIRKLGGKGLLEVTSLGPSALFGEEVLNAFDNGRPYAHANFTIVAATNCFVLQLSMEDLSKLTPEMMEKIRNATSNKATFRVNRLGKQIKVRTEKIGEPKRIATAEYHLSDTSIRNFGKSPRDGSISPKKYTGSGRSKSPPLGRPATTSPMRTSGEDLSWWDRPATTEPSTVTVTADVVVHSSGDNNNNNNKRSRSPNKTVTFRPATAMELTRPSTMGASSFYSNRQTATAPNSRKISSPMPLEPISKGLEAEEEFQKEEAKKPISSLDSTWAPWDGTERTNSFINTLPDAQPKEEAANAQKKIALGTVGLAKHSRQPNATANNRKMSLLGNKDNNTNNNDNDSDLQQPVFRNDMSPEVWAEMYHQKMQADFNGKPSQQQQQLQQQQQQQQAASMKRLLRHAPANIMSALTGDTPIQRPATVWGSRVVNVREDPWLADVVSELPPPSTADMGYASTPILTMPEVFANKKAMQQEKQQQKAALSTIPKRIRSKRINVEEIHIPSAAASNSIIRRQEERTKATKFGGMQLAPWAQSNRIDRAAIINGPDGRSRVISIQKFARSAKTVKVGTGHDEEG